MTFETVWETPTTGRLDPQAAALLDLFAKAPKIDEPRDDRYIAIVRMGFAAFAKLAGFPEPVDRVEDAQVNGPRGPIPIRLYRPRTSRPAPLLVWFHGGGFIVGDLDTFDAPMRALANRCRCPVLAVDYRLAPEHPFPAGIEDGYAALAWAAAHMDDIGSDRLIVGGDSAGGNIATVVAMLAHERGGPRLALQVLLYPDADSRAGVNYPSWRDHDGCVLDRVATERWHAMYLPDNVDRMQRHVSPALAPAQSLSGLPPAFIVTAEFDPLRDEGEIYAERLREASVPVALVRYPGMIHGFMQMAAKLDAASQVMDRIAAVLADL